MSNLRKFTKILTDVLGVPENTIHDELTPKDVGSWDSMNAMIIVARLEKQFQVRFNIQDITEVRNVRDIKASLTRYGIRFQEDQE